MTSWDARTRRACAAMAISGLVKPRSRRRRPAATGRHRRQSMSTRMAARLPPAKNGNLYPGTHDGTPLGVSAAFKGLDRCRRRRHRSRSMPIRARNHFRCRERPAVHLNIDGSNFPNFPSPGASCISNTAVGDVNHDGVLDVVMLTEVDSSTCTTRRWDAASRLAALVAAEKANGDTSPALADFDFDGFLEIVVANSFSNTPSLSRVGCSVIRATSRGGRRLAIPPESSPTWPILRRRRPTSVREKAARWVRLGRGGNVARLPDHDRRLRALDTVADDVDGDGYIDLVLSGWDKNVYIFDFPAAWSAAAAQWPTLKHDAHRSSTFGFVFDIAPPSPPTTLASTSHTPSAWSNDPTIDVAWSGASDPSGIGGYSVVWDTSPSTLPDQTIDTVTPNSTCRRRRRSVALVPHPHRRCARPLTPALHSDRSGSMSPPGAVPGERRPSDVHVVERQHDRGHVARGNGPGTTPAAAAAAVRSGPARCRRSHRCRGARSPRRRGQRYERLLCCGARTRPTPDATIETTGLTTTSPALLADGAAHWLFAPSTPPATPPTASTLWVRTGSTPQHPQPSSWYRMAVKCGRTNRCKPSAGGLRMRLRAWRRSRPITRPTVARPIRTTS